MGSIVRIEESIEISASPEAVYAFISDGSKDPQWRTEVDRMEVEGPSRVDTLMTEYSTFFNYFHTVTPTVIREAVRPARFVAETPASHPDWLRSTRTIEEHGDNTARFTYVLEFDTSTMRQLSPIVPPGAAIGTWYARRARRYLRNLKRLVEAEARA